MIRYGPSTKAALRQMNKEFVLNIILLIGINVLIKPIYLFAIDARIQYLVGQEVYGVFFTLFNFAYLFQIVNDLGIQNYSSSKIAGDDAFVTTNIRQLLGAKALFSILFIAAVILGGLVMQYPSYYFYLLLLLCVNQVLAALFIYLRSCIAAVGRYRVDTWISAIDKVVMILLLGYLLYVVGMTSDFKIEYLVYAQMLSYIVACTIAAVLLGRVIPDLLPRLDLRYTIALIRKTIPYALVLLLMTLYTRMDAVMLERMLDNGSYQSGIYASCYRYMEALSMIGYLFAALLLPMYSRLLATHTSLNELSHIALRILATIVLTLAIVVTVYRRELILWRYPEATEVYFRTLALLMISFVCVSLSYIYGTMHVARGDLRAINKLYTAGVVANILLNLWLIPRYQVVGAAAATVGTQGLVMAGQYYLSKRSFALAIDWGLILKVSFCSLLVWMMSTAIREVWSPPWTIGLLAAILSGGVAALLLRIIQVDMLLSLLRKAER